MVHLIWSRGREACLQARDTGGIVGQPAIWPAEGENMGWGFGGKEDLPGHDKSGTAVTMYSHTMEADDLGAWQLGRWLTSMRPDSHTGSIVSSGVWAEPALATL